MPEADTEQPAFTCPACGRPLYDRRRPNCGYCGKPTPPGMRLTQTRIDEIGKELAGGRKRVVQFKRTVDSLGPVHRSGWR